jgi:hypothetical protein
MSEKGPTRAQLQRKVSHLELEVAALKDKLVYYQAGDDVRREGEHWYELLEYFDPEKIQKLPVKDGRAFIMGRLDGVTIVEVGSDMPQAQIAKLGTWLKENGIEALVVSAGVRFLKLATVSDELEATLDEHERAQDAKDEAESGIDVQADGL